MNERLKLYRKRCGLSQEEAARQLNMSRPTLTSIESGKRAVKVEEVPVFSKLYGVSLDELFYGETEDSLKDKLNFYFDKLQDKDKLEVLQIVELKLNNSLNIKE